MLIESQIFPPILSFCIAYHFGKVTWESQETYQKNSFRNRYYLLNGSSHLCMSVPLKKGKHNGCPIKQVEIYQPEIWPKKHWHSIQSIYGRFPFFEFYADAIRDTLLSGHCHLYNLNLALFDTINAALQLDIETGESLTYQAPSGDTDWRNRILPAISFSLDITSPYPWVYISKISILDLIFGKGPETELVLNRIAQLIFGTTP